MITTLLYQESPVIGIILTTAPVILCVLTYTKLAIGLTILLIFMLFFYRYYQHTLRYHDNVVVCPCDGTVTDIHQDNDFYFVSIFLSPFNVHTQMYPVNGVVTSQYYDKTGIFALATNKAKSRYNDKVIHQIKTQYGYVTMTQISGFLPRCIVYTPKVNHRVQAGEYLGMIKFGSRVDLKIPKTTHLLPIDVNQKITFGDLIYKF